MACVMVSGLFGAKPLQRNSADLFSAAPLGINFNTTWGYFEGIIPGKMSVKMSSAEQPF